VLLAAMAPVVSEVLQEARDRAGRCVMKGVKALPQMVPVEKVRAEMVLPPIAVVAPRGSEAIAAGPTVDRKVAADPMVPQVIGADRVVRRVAGEAPKVVPQIVVVLTGRPLIVVRKTGRNGLKSTTRCNRQTKPWPDKIVRQRLNRDRRIPNRSSLRLSSRPKQFRDRMTSRT